jgi:hypothetical protein
MTGRPGCSQPEAPQRVGPQQYGAGLVVDDEHVEPSVDARDEKPAQALDPYWS